MTGPPYSPRQRAAYLAMIDRIGGHWLALFDGEREFYSTAYWDLLTALWAADAPMRKTEALAAMTAVKSSHTAGKYLDVALRRGLVEERENPCDARSKLVVLAPAMKARLDGFLDEAVSEVLDTANDVGADPAADGDA